MIDKEEVIDILQEEMVNLTSIMMVAQPEEDVLQEMTTWETKSMEVKSVNITDPSEEVEMKMVMVMENDSEVVEVVNLEAGVNLDQEEIEVEIEEAEVVNLEAGVNLDQEEIEVEIEEVIEAMMVLVWEVVEEAEMMMTEDIEEEVVEKMMMEDIEEEEGEEEVAEEVLKVMLMTKEVVSQCSIKMVLPWIINL